MKKAPVRTCVICRQKFDKRDLLRIVRTPEGKIEFDPTGKKNGRGAYLCTSDACIENIKNTSKIASTLDVKVEKDDLLNIIEQIRNYRNE